ncbi:ABC transporter substrate-binding protein [Agromyces mediolanus]|uniref:Sugar ABC transporter substrate-binding protein n=1 Tax=Agromyces mediolanus TaxID=41986 RepID=A0A918CLJ1_AGRME|nr:sugar ABC transporter substrate-binding protein [Agromyces mediolanus]GGR29046.1 sugar ABC transporter substrate-binding protein [Agromyces mediolanus]GLJ72161.1 sugar ABC transporter substrate-binding protein [Agromyces mediolanus]
MSTPTWRRAAATAAALAVAVPLASCAAAGDAASDRISVLMVGNPQMTDLQELTEQHFTAETGLAVDFTVLPENELRDRVAQDLAAGVSKYDVISINSSETPYYADLGWLQDLTAYTEQDPAFDVDDVLPSMLTTYSASDGGIHGIPFYGESSFVMYRTDLFEAAGITMPEHPTWDQIAEYAAALDSGDTAGICLRGQPAAGQMFAPLGTIVNTFGGTWFTEDWEPQVDSPEFTEAVQFYVDLVRDSGETGAAQAGFTECLNLFGQGKAAMWYDATAGAGLVENPETSTVAGKVGYAYAPTKLTDYSGWIAGWGWGVPKNSAKADAAWEFISWASSAGYEELVGSEIGWSNVPDGKRESTYSNADYLAHAGAYAPIVLDSIKSIDPRDPGVQPRPTIGTIFVAIPEFSLLATRTAEQINAILAGQADSVADALAVGQELAIPIGQEYAGE